MRLLRPVAALGAAALVLLAAAPALADPFPVQQIDGSTPVTDESWALPQPDQNSAALSKDVLSLTTPSPGFQAGTAVIDDSFRSDVAFTVDFDYKAYGGGNPGDAMTFFLMDAATAPNLGGSGGSSGYVAMQGGYVAVGLDNAGNFSADNQFPNRPSSVTLRGAALAAPTAWPVLDVTGAPGGTVSTSATQSRHVQVQVEPSGTDSLTVTVRMDAAAGGPLQTVYDHVDVRSLGRGQPARPARLDLGFSAGTGGATNNYEVSNVVATADADLSVAKSGPTSVAPGSDVTWTVTASSDDTNPVEGAVVTDTIPAGLTGVTWSCTPQTGGTCPDPATGDATAGQPLDVPVDLLRSGSVQITVAGTAPVGLAGTTVTNTATITSGTRTETDPSDNSATTSTRVRELPDLTPTVSVDPTPLVYGQGVTWTVDVENLATVDGLAPGATVHVSVPPVVASGSVVAPAGCTPQGDGYDCDLGTLAAGGSTTVTFTATVSGALDACTDGTSTFAATTSSDLPDADEDNDSDSVAVPCTVPVDLAVVKTGTAQATVGDEVTYTVTVSSAGDVPAPATTISDDLPPGLDDATWTCTVSDGSSCAPASGTGDVSAVATIPAHGTAVVVVTASTTTVGEVTNVAGVTTCDVCTGVGVLTASATTSVVAAPVTPTPTPTPTDTSTATPAPTPSASPAPTGPGELGTTGADAVAPLVWAVILVAAGIVVTIVVRRRSRG
ncbi:DUF11 domain-containing protein [Cellulomonas sp. HZM]|uniref:lectin-like domain-containing protein n=1 Tax=Cellulomonas sp. HZM TaxID=1454010 RepID=UPI000493ABC5|nr:DUF11 domain-containing protein [Cellulomonas sp. HZM]